jgi:hypothetical protein
MLSRLLSLIDPLAAWPPQGEVKSGKDLTVMPSIQGIEVSPQAEVPPVGKNGLLGALTPNLLKSPDFSMFDCCGVADSEVSCCP